VKRTKCLPRVFFRGKIWLDVLGDVFLDFRFKTGLYLANFEKMEGISVGAGREFETRETDLR